VQLENLRTHPAISARLSAGQLNLHAWMYKIETGEVFDYQPDEGQFLPLTKMPVATERRSRGLSTDSSI
jgi:carbonic anhydrase